MRRVRKRQLSFWMKRKRVVLRFYGLKRENGRVYASFLVGVADSRNSNSVISGFSVDITDKIKEKILELEGER